MLTLARKWLQKGKERNKNTCSLSEHGGPAVICSFFLLSLCGGLACGRACTWKVYRPSTNWYSAVHLRFGNILSVFIASNPEGPDLFDASAVYISPINIPSIGTTLVNYRHPRYNRHHYAPPLSVCSAALSCYGWQLCRGYRKAIEENFVLKKDIKRNVIRCYKRNGSS